MIMKFPLGVIVALSSIFLKVNGKKFIIILFYLTIYLCLINFIVFHIFFAIFLVVDRPYRVVRPVAR